MTNIKLSIITVTFNNERNIDKYLEALLKNLPENTEVIIADNNSSDKTVERIKNYPSIKLLENNQNLGFAKANNIAVKKSQGEYLFFLNPDTQVLDDAINKLLNFADENEAVGIIAPKLVQLDKKVQPTVRKLPTILGAIKEYYFGIKNSYEAYVPNEETPVVVESVVGGAILIKRGVFEKVGKFNEKYFLYYEDLELCKQVLQKGYKIFYFPQAVIIHEVGGSISEQKNTWIVDAAKIYHGVVAYFFLYWILRFRNIF
ncbi:MAG: glycosyltransferase family 2 protein [Candidatus Daviesbacteria bacterium]|nr:glycosyltransferase family 2 protein [Candidatus Daviesbacteria bacterium]